MPELARFFWNYYPDVHGSRCRAQNPSFSYYYQEEAAVFGIEPVELIAGDLPRKQRRFVEAWAEMHQEDLFKNWKLLQSGRLPEPIEPLK